jgi:hypothetical protein
MIGVSMLKWSLFVCRTKVRFDLTKVRSVTAAKILIRVNDHHRPRIIASFCVVATSWRASSFPRVCRQRSALR